MVSVRLEVGVHHNRVAGLEQPIDLPQSAMTGASRTEAMAPLAEPRLEDRLDHELHRLLDDAILDRGDAQRSRLAVALGDVHPLDGLRAVGALPQRRRQLRQILICLRREPIDRLPIHTRRAGIGLDLRPGRRQRCGCKHLVDQREPLAALDPVHQGRQHALRPHRGFRPPPGSPGG
jgi:hypothetical protein